MESTSMLGKHPVRFGGIKENRRVLTLNLKLDASSE